MDQEVSNDLKDLIVQFVNTYSNVVDLELDQTLDPKLWFMPIDSTASKKEAAHYFLLAASLSDHKLTGNPRNIRMLLNHLHQTLGEKLYTSEKPTISKRKSQGSNKKTSSSIDLGTSKPKFQRFYAQLTDSWSRKQAETSSTTQPSFSRRVENQKTLYNSSHTQSRG